MASKLSVNSKCKVIYFIIDDKDYLNVSKYKWWVKHNNYVYTQIKRKTIYLHRLIMGQSSLEIDHINHNALDNRRINLRFVTRSQNNINKKNVYSGVSKFRNKWRARIKIGGKEIHIGIFPTRDSALKTRIKKEIELFNKHSKHYGN